MGVTDAACHVHAVELFVVEADPAFEVAKNFEGVVAELIFAVIVAADASELSGCQWMGEEQLD